MKTIKAIRTSKKLFPLALFLVLVTYQATAQSSMPSIHSTNQKNGTWKYTYEFILKEINNSVNTCGNLSKQQLKKFSDLHKEEISEDLNKLYEETKNGTINLENAYLYVDPIATRYSNEMTELKNEEAAGSSSTTAFSMGKGNYETMADTILPDAGVCQPSCTNFGFENGNLNGWKACYAMNYGLNQPPGVSPYKNPACFGPTGNYKYTANVGGIFSAVTYPNANQDSVTSVGTTDKYCGNLLPSVCPLIPGNKHSVRVGDEWNSDGFGIGILEQKFLVTKDNAGITYYYATVLEDPGHGKGAEPYFRVTLFDQNKDTIECASYFVDADNKTNFQPVSGKNVGYPGWVMYLKPWSCVYVPLKKYMGQCVTIQFVSADCAEGAHAGYSYVDLTCDTITIKQTGTCKTKTLKAPDVCGASFKWLGPCISGPDDGASITVTCSGIYKLVLSSIKSGCSDTIVDTVVIDSKSIGLQIKGMNLKCKGDKSGSAVVTLAGNTTDYTFTWAPSGGNGTTATGLSAGTYTCYVASTDGCDTSITVTLTEPPAFLHTPTVTPASCGMADGSAGLQESGGTPGYTYLWNTGASTSGIQNIKTGVYSITITDASGCKDTASIQVPGGAGFTAGVSKTDILCYGGTNGTATVSVTAGNPPYTYSWLPGGQSSSSLSGLNAGDYMCVIYDKNGKCGDTVFVTIKEPKKIFLDVNRKDITCNGDCNGSVSVIAAGATPPFTYVWSNSGSAGSGSNFSLCAGSYTISVTDKNNCTIDSIFTLTEPPPLSFVKTTSPVTCNKNNGSATIMVSGGTPTYTYLWNTGASTSAISNLSLGNYTLSVSDSKGCKDTVQLTVQEIKNAVTSISAPVNLPCYGDTTGTLSVTVTGGSLPYSYLWSSGQSSSALINLSAGTFTVTITDANGCSSSTTQKITQPTPLLTPSATQVICQGETTTLKAATSGGVPPYNYLWSTGGAQDTISNSPLVTTSYPLTVTDANGCTFLQTDTIVVNSLPTAAFTAPNVCVGINTLFTDASAVQNGKIAKSIWDFGDNSKSSDANPSHTYAQAGTYSVTLTVSNGSCESTTARTVIVYPTPTADFTANPQPASFLDPYITFTDLSINAAKGHWYFGDYTDTLYFPKMNPIHKYPTENVQGGQSFDVKLSIVNQYGCPDSITKTIHFNPEWTFYVPNAFSPNGDGKNEVFYGTGVGIIEKEMWIFDRWGLEIFHSTNLNGTWDGKVQSGTSEELVQQDVYVWVIKVKEVFGKTHKYMGHVTVVR